MCPLIAWRERGRSRQGAAEDVSLRGPRPVSRGGAGWGMGAAGRKPTGRRDLELPPPVSLEPGARVSMTHTNFEIYFTNK